MVWVDSDAELAKWCAHFATLPVIAIDTEFIRRTTFYPITGLIQISDGVSAVLIDPLAITHWQDMIALMTNQNVIKVFHACSEDLEVFDRLLGVIPTPFYDTQVAEAYVSGRWSLSYVKLIMAYRNIEIAKDETRSDWLKRPLTDAQKRYAALDVAYLIDVYHRQLKTLNEKNMLAWALEDCDAITHQYRLNTNAEINWSNVKSAWRLSPKSLTLLRLLFIWRDKTARAEDVPKGQVIKDRTLWAIAKLFPDSHNTLSRTEEMTGRQHRLYGEHILKTVNMVNELSPDEYQLSLELPLPSQAGELSKAIKAFVTDKAKVLGIAPEAALKKKQLDPLVRHLFLGEALNLIPPTMTGWRKSEIIDPILQRFAKA
ncbi:ribonuclease D [Marinomonas sp. 42_23_T18]|nr:ribonuclease D [Marinomonas sp. 42_23_T18]